MIGRWMVLAAVAGTLPAGCEWNRIEVDPPGRANVSRPAKPGGVVEIGSVPETTGEFDRLRRRLCRTPEGAAAAMVAVLLATSADETTGLTFATMLLDPDRLRKGRLHQGREPGQHYRDLLRIARRTPRLARSYLVGSSPGNGYEPERPLRVRWQPHPSPNPSPKAVRVMLVSSGADRPRPVTLTRGEDGLWQVSEASSLCVGVRSPGE